VTRRVRHAQTTRSIAEPVKDQSASSSSSRVRLIILLVVETSPSSMISPDFFERGLRAGTESPSNLCRSFTVRVVRRVGRPKPFRPFGEDGTHRSIAELQRQRQAVDLAALRSLRKERPKAGPLPAPLRGGPHGGARKTPGNTGEPGGHEFPYDGSKYRAVVTYLTDRRCHSLLSGATAAHVGFRPCLR
jgi:hypothetical protein